MLMDLLSAQDLSGNSQGMLLVHGPVLVSDIKTRICGQQLKAEGVCKSLAPPRPVSPYISIQILFNLSIFLGKYIKFIYLKKTMQVYQS